MKDPAPTTCAPTATTATCSWVDTAQKRLWEMFSSHKQSDGWHAEGISLWKLDTAYPRTARGQGCTSADAAGLAITPGLVGFRETKRGEIHHAFRLAIPNANIRSGVADNHNVAYPATHGTRAATSATGMPYGARIRLKATLSDTDARITNAASHTIVRALKKYGMILADGGNLPIMAESDQIYKDATPGEKGWEDVLNSHDLNFLKPSDFEVIGIPKAGPEAATGRAQRFLHHPRRLRRPAQATARLQRDRSAVTAAPVDALPAFSELAKSLGGTFAWQVFADGKYTHVPEFTLVVSNVKLTVLPTSYKNTLVGVRALAELREPVTRAPIELRRETDFDRLGKRLGLNREYATGDAAFDAAVYIESDAADTTLARILGSEAVRSLAQRLFASKLVQSVHVAHHVTSASVASDLVEQSKRAARSVSIALGVHPTRDAPNPQTVGEVLALFTEFPQVVQEAVDAGRGPYGTRRARSARPGATPALAPRPRCHRRGVRHVGRCRARLASAHPRHARVGARLGGGRRDVGGHYIRVRARVRRSLQQLSEHGMVRGTRVRRGAHGRAHHRIPKRLARPRAPHAAERARYVAHR